MQVDPSASNIPNKIHHRLTLPPMFYNNLPFGIFFSIAEKELERFEKEEEPLGKFTMTVFRVLVIRIFFPVILLRFRY